MQPGFVNAFLLIIPYFYLINNENMTIYIKHENIFTNYIAGENNKVFNEPKHSSDYLTMYILYIFCRLCIGQS